MTIRILGGKWKGQLLRVPQHGKVRPTSSKIRQAVFNICQFFIENARVLDLYAGSGAIGLEALSRGASCATFIENDPHSFRYLTENIKKLAGPHHKDAIALKGDAFHLIQNLQNPFDFIYIDPPYDYPHLDDLLHRVENQNLLTNNGTLFLETPAQDPAPQASTLHFDTTYQYGKTALHRYTMPYTNPKK